MERLRIGVYAAGGRIGKLVARLLPRSWAAVQVPVMVGSGDVHFLADQIGWDTVHGSSPVSVVNDRQIMINDQIIECRFVRDPAMVDWSGCDVVIDSSGAFRSSDLCEPFFESGAKRVLIPAPPKGPVDGQFVFGVNHEGLMPDMRVVSPGSCTTNAAAPVLKVLHENFGVVQMNFTTVHAVTNGQNLLDGSHKRDLRRGRAGMQNIVPTTTGAQQALQKIFPHLEGRIHGRSVRVPVPDGSLIVAQITLQDDSTSVDQVLEALHEAVSQSSRTLAVVDVPLVSSRIIGRSESAIVDACLVSKVGHTTFEIYIWYDNEFGFANRLCDLAKLMARQQR